MSNFPFILTHLNTNQSIYAGSISGVYIDDTTIAYFKFGDSANVLFVLLTALLGYELHRIEPRIYIHQSINNL